MPRLAVAADRINYLLEMVTAGAVLKTAPSDDPIPFEEALLSAFLAGFIPTWNRMTKSLLTSGRLPDLVKLSVDPKKKTFDPTFFQQYFEKYFNEPWVEGYRTVTREILSTTWDEALDYAEASYEDINPQAEAFEETEDTNRLFGFLLDLTVISILAGALSQVALPLAQRAAFQAGLTEEKRPTSEIETIFSNVFETQAETTYVHYFSTLAEISANRVRNIGRITAWAQLGATTLQWFTAEDERVCGVCSVMHGKEFTVSKVQDILTGLPDLTTREQAMEALPFASREGDTLVTPNGDSVSISASGDELLALGLGLPPIHGLCRCRVEVKN